MWDLRYRPLRYADVLGQEGSVHLLKSRLRNGTAFDTSYIFAGGYGRGKTTLGRIHARAMLCLDLDKKDPEPCNKCDNCTAILNEQPGAFSERDGASNGTIEHARGIVEELPYVLPNAPRRIYLIDEAHRMSTAAQDVLLKPVEDKKMVAMLCTTEATKIRGPIRSRCEEYTIRRATREEILARVRMVLEIEKVQYEDDAVLIVIDHAGGHVRDVLNGLEMISQMGSITVANVREYLHLAVVTLYYQTLLNLDNPVKAVTLVEQACEQTEPEDVAAGIAEAAMNSFRLANGIFADFSVIDRGLAEQVYAKYGRAVVRLASWFLGSRYATRLSLTRDVVVLSQNPSNLPLEGPPPPVVFSSVQPAAATPITTSVPTSIPTVAPAAPTAEVPKETKPAPVDSYTDPTPPTEIEAALVNGTLPRQRSTHDTTPPPKVKNGHHEMTPLEWRGLFDRLLRKKMPSAVLK